MRSRHGSDAGLGAWKAWVLGLGVLVVLTLLDDLTRQCGVTFADGIVVAAMGWYGGVAGAVVATAVSTVLAATTSLWDGSVAGRVPDPIRTFVWLGFGLGAAVLRNRVDAVERHRAELDRAYSLLSQDLEASRMVQKAFLDRPLPKHPAMRVSVRFTAARGPSGDFYDVNLHGHKLALCVADVSGKGAPAALVTGLLRGLLLELADHRSPAEILTALHVRLTPYLPFSMFVTCFYGVLDLQNGHLQYANAGHDPPLLWSPAHDRITELEGTGFPLGVVEEQEFAQRELQLNAGDILLLYTDGLVNARLPDGTRLGEEPVRAALSQAWAPPDAIIRALGSLVPEPGPKGLDDDILLLAVQWQGTPLHIGTARRSATSARCSRPLRRRRS